MILARYTPRIRDARLMPGGVAIANQSIALNLDLVDALEEIRVYVTITCNSTAPGSVTLDGLLKILKRVTLSVTEDGRPRNVVNMSGMALLEMASVCALNQDRSTNATIAAHLGGFYSGSGVYRLCYRIPLIHPILVEPLRTHCLLPLVAMTQQPILTLDFASEAEMYGSNAPTSVVAEVVLRKAVMDLPTYNTIAADRGGFIQGDLIETAYNLAVGASGEQVFKLPQRGFFLNLLFRHYLGGAAVTRADISESNTIGAETEWRIESGNVKHDWFRMKDLQIENDFSRPLDLPYGPNLWSTGFPINNAGTTSGTAWVSAKNVFGVQVLAGALSAGLAVQNPASVSREYLTDGLAEANELGSLLNADLPAKRGQDLNFIGNVASTATYGSTLYIAGYRMYDRDGNLNNWRAIKL